MADPNTPGVKKTHSRVTADQIELEPWYKDGNDDVVEPDRVTLQTQYFWKHWVRILGVGPASLLVRLRMYCYDNRQTGERREWCFPGQRTLADELGVHRETIMTWLRRLEMFEFIRRTPRMRWSPEHGRPVRTTNAYRIKMWDPVTPDHEGAAFLGNAQRLLDDSPKPIEREALSDKSKKPTYGRGPVDNRRHESKKTTYDAVEKSGSGRDYLEGVRNERNVDLTITSQIESIGTRLNPQLSARSSMKRLANILPQIQTTAKNRDRLIHIEDLAGRILDVLGDGRSRPFYRMVARRFLDAGLERLIHQVLSEIKASDHDGALRNRGAVFTARMKELAAVYDVDLGTAA